MKRVLFLLLSLSLISLSCELTTNDGPVTVPIDPGIPGVSFTVDTTYMVASPAMLVAKGIVSNNGPASISSPWYVKCTFFADTGRTVVLGTNDTRIGVPLSGGQAAYWMITLSNSNVDVRRFPNFTVGGFTATYDQLSDQVYTTPHGDYFSSP